VATLLTRAYAGKTAADGGPLGGGGAEEVVAAAGYGGEFFFFTDINIFSAVVHESGLSAN